ncbi:hypothetical protein Tco_1184424 [Tanacetum coccineum]
MGLHTSQEMDTAGFGVYWDDSAREAPDKGELDPYWRAISSIGNFLGSTPSYTSIRDLIIRLCHRLIACSIAGRSQTPEKVTVTDLFYLRGLDIDSVNIPYLMARYLRRFDSGRKIGALISGGQFVARLATHFRLLTEQPQDQRGSLTLRLVPEGAEVTPDADIANGISKLLGASGASFTSYSVAPVPYQRKVRWRTREASTSGESSMADLVGQRIDVVGYSISGITLADRDEEIENLKARLLVKEGKAVEAIRLRAETSKFEIAEQSLRDEVKVLKEQNATLEQERTDLGEKVTNLAASVKVHELETSSVGLQEKVTAYENFINQLEKFQDEKMQEVNEKFDKLCADFVEMALHFEEKFYPHLLTTVSGRRWLLTYGVELAIAKCLNNTEYLSALGAAIGKAVEKGMQEGLSAGITHGAEANKDASVEMIMNLLRLEDILAERLGLTESKPHVNQLMVPNHHSSDQRVVGASTLSLSLDVSSVRVRKIKENIVNHISFLRGVFVPLSEPLSVIALGGTEGTSGTAPEITTALSTTFSYASAINPIFVDDYEATNTEDQAAVDENVTIEDNNPFPNVDDVELITS